MLITPEDLQIRRSPLELRHFAETVRNAVRMNPVEMRDGTLKKGLYKEFLDEILPLSYFAVIEYPGDFSIQPVLGNQGFDVVVYNESGVVHEHLELTAPHDGAEASQDARQRAVQGKGKVIVEEPHGDFERITPFVIATCKRKAEKDYSDAKLVVVVNVQPPLSGYEDSYEQRIHSLRDQVRQVQFKAAGVVLFFPPGRIEHVAGWTLKKVRSENSGRPLI